MIIGVSSNDTTEGVVSVSSLTFTPSNWNLAQQVIVTGVVDGVTDGNTNYLINTAPAVSSDTQYNGLDAADVTVTNTDNGPNTIVLTNAAISSYNGQDINSTFTLQNGGLTLDIVGNGWARRDH